ncbi:unnamed protein product [Adineta steineri]|uniref:Methyltransferase FkbM domain-containing protein n=1 Tax=Adineta steineri TaxID=433720 RepID=A0A814ZMY3_9BILA|nr:unnamed protein product [Adineta steineri]CAF3644210.1 unnamed protein product [Adineta steineri]
MSENNLLDGCRYVYIDLGTNIGVQIRKLYEPHLYPGAAVLQHFKNTFGSNISEVCSVGFEANPIHNSYLTEFENYCLARKWRVKIFKSTAVSYVDKNLTFYVNPGDNQNNQWGASLLAHDMKVNVTVQAIDITSWFKKTVLIRKIPPGTMPPKVMMKTDIEGHDSAVLANLIFSGAYCSIDLIYGEHFNNEFQQAISRLKKDSNTCKTELIALDDESYYLQRFPFILPVQQANY